jgi:hypothetical protein
MTMRYKFNHSLITRTPTIVASHICFRPGFIEEHKFFDFKSTLLSLPAFSTCLHVGTMLFAGAQSFF